MNKPEKLWAFEDFEEHKRFSHLFDALGLDGELYGEIDHLGFLMTSQAIFEHSGFTRVHQQTFIEQLDQDHFDMRSQGHGDRLITAYQAGTVVGLRLLYPTVDVSNEASEALITRALQAIRISHRESGGQPEMFFRGGVTRAQQYLKFSGVNEAAFYVDRYCDIAIKDSDKFRRKQGRQVVRQDVVLRDQSVLERHGSAVWNMVIKGLGVAATCIPGYSVQPPPHQTAEDGSWDPSLGNDNDENMS